MAAPVASHAALISLGPDAATEGLVYTLETQTTANPLTNLFALTIMGENVVGTDTRLGRTGINAIAFTKPANFASAAMLNPPTGFNFVVGGLNSSGCDGSGNFLCFDNTAIPPIPTTPLAGTLVFVFSETLSSGTFAGYAPDFKIDWVGPTINNYSLVSEGIPLNTTCPDCVITPVADVPEPATIAMFGVGLLGLGFLRRQQG